MSETTRLAATLRALTSDPAVPLASPEPIDGLSFVLERVELMPTDEGVDITSWVVWS